MAGRELVIILDDDTSMLRALQRVLRGRGFDVEVFDTAEAFHNNARLGDAGCLLLDINLNGTCEIDLKRQLTLSGCQLPVIFITASEREGTWKAAAEAGCVAALKKPFPSAALIESVESAVRGADPRLA